MTKNQFCGISVTPPGSFSTVKNTSLTEEGDVPVAADEALHTCGAVKGNVGGWVFLMMMTFIILLVEGNNFYRVSYAQNFVFQK